MTNDLIDKFLKSKKIAVVGSLSNKTKVAYMIIERLLESKKYDVFPVNPGKMEINGIKVYPTISALPDDIELLDIVTPPEITLQILQECLAKGINNVWMQPGTSDEKVISFCKEKNISFVSNTCIMRYV